MTENEKRKKRVCFTGHRPEKLNDSEETLKKELRAEILNSINEGFNVFISGMARGVDIWAAEIIIELKNKGYDLKLICAIPYDGFESKWSKEWQIRYNNIICNSDLIRCISPKYSIECFQIRNEWMVNHSAKVIAVFNGEKGGTYNTIKYATKENLRIKIIE